eukprot:m.13935 g.13935  ORF g.13935 m.13935 type:complete len:156 (-) comp10249_c0_seq1:51-518(-)
MLLASAVTMDDKIDAALVAYMEEYEQYQSLQVQLQKQMSEGYLCLAQARKTAGVIGISQLQYPSEMAANTTVSCLCDQQQVDVSRTTLGEDRSKAGNPLRWFGVLAPNALRTAQTTFKQATDISARLVESKLRLQACEMAYHTLRRQLSEAEAAS